MSLPRIIGITGYARHGKDTIAEVLSRELGYNRVALADIMKQALLVLDPWVTGVRLSSAVEAGGWEEAKTDPEVRRLLQVFGTEVGRNMLGEDVWIEALVRNTPGFYGSERKIVIPDIRFINEAEFIRRVHGEVWRVVRVGPDENTPFDNGIGLGHESERQIGAIRVDDTLINVGSRSDFQAKVFRYLKHRLAVVQGKPEPERAEEIAHLVEDARAEYREALDKLADR